VLRQSSGEELFSTYGHVLVFEDQYVELVTNMVDVCFPCRDTAYLMLDA